MEAEPQTFSPTPPPLAGQSSERSTFWVQRWHRAKDKANGKEQRGPGRGSREKILEESEKEGSEGSQEKRGGIDRRLTLPSPTHPRPVWTPEQPYCAPESRPRCGRFGGPDHGYHNPPSFTFRKYLYPLGLTQPDSSLFCGALPQPPLRSPTTWCLSPLPTGKFLPLPVSV